MYRESTLIMKTVLIFDQLDANLKFFVLEGDQTRFNNVYINQCFEEPKKAQKQREKLQDELLNLLYEKEGGEFKFPVTASFPTEVAREEGVVVIVAGFLP